MPRHEKHHMLPISLGMGSPDVSANIIVVTTKEHKLIHSLLFAGHAKLRNHRMRTNHKLILDDEYVKSIRRIHLAYFEKINQLPERLIKRHMIKMRELVEYVKEEYDLKEEIKRAPGNSFLDDFYHYLRQYHGMLYYITLKGL
jgi:hypothetical protein